MPGPERPGTRARIHDVTLRDGNHALRHSLTTELVRDYCDLASRSPVDSVEIGHGNGLGASSALVGIATTCDHELLSTAREHLPEKRLTVHCIPGFATVRRDLAPAMGIGVDVFRIGTHVTESDTGAKHLEFVRSNGKEAVGVLMMSHMASIDRLVAECRKLEAFGASSIILMDSAGHFVPKDVTVRIRTIAQYVGADLGFHAHNNLGVAVANALAARAAGAVILDGASMGLGAGAGNAQLECMAAVLSREEEDIDYGDVSKYLSMSELIRQRAADSLPRTTGSSLMSGMAGVFSGYAPQVAALSEEFDIDSSLIWRELGARSIVAGQETIIREVALAVLDADRDRARAG